MDNNKTIEKKEEKRNKHNGKSKAMENKGASPNYNLTPFTIFYLIKQ